MVQCGFAGNGTPLTSCFLSDILGKKVYDKDGRFMGAVNDILAESGQKCPEIQGLTLARRGARQNVQLGGDELVRLATSRHVRLQEDPRPAPEPGERHFLVRDTLYDKQIVDINGAKVERVNDVRIVFFGEKPYVVQVDVGFTGLVRRLGFEGGMRRIARTFGKELKDELIHWGFVQPLPESAKGPIHISLRHEEIKKLHAGELADIIEDLDRDERITLVRTIGAEDAADALEEADIEVQTAILRDLEAELAADILEEMEPAAAVDVIDKLPQATQKSIMDAMEAEERAQIELLVQAEEDTAAALMTVDFIACPQTATASEALDQIRRDADEIESITYVYCLDDASRLAGVVSLRDLLLAEPGAPLWEVMNRRLATLDAGDDLEEVANLFLKYRFKALPVVDTESQLQGIVTFQHSFEELLPLYYRIHRMAN